MNKPIVALYGPISSGKSTLAMHLQSTHNFARVPFAAPLKSMLHVIGLSPEDTDGANKSVPHPLLCGKTPREAMQTLGTEWGRNLIGTDIWTNLWHHRVRNIMEKGVWFDTKPGRPRDKFEQVSGIVVDDLRFKSEADFLRTLPNVTIIRADRHKEVQPVVHQSEAEFRFITPDYVIDNTGTIAASMTQLDTILKHVGW